MFVTLVAVLCHALHGDPVCLEEIVTDSRFTAQAGKSDAAIEMSALTMTQCLVNGQTIASVWMAGHPAYHTWTLHGWKCAPGHYEPGRRA